MPDVFTWLLVFIRSSAFLLIFPIFSAPNIPIRLRVALAAFLAMMVSSALTNPVDPGSMHLIELVILLFKEIAVGILLGFVTRLVFYGAQLAGHFISTEIGLQTSTLITPEGVHVDVPGAVLNLLAMMLFLSLDMHHVLIVAFQRTYEIVPIGSGGMSNPLFDHLTMKTSRIILLAVQLAAPLIAVGFLIGLVMKMLGKAVPQMNVFFESFTIRLSAGLVVFGFTINLSAQRISDYLRQVPRDVMEVGRLLAGG